MLRLNDIRDTGRFFRIHVEDPVDGEKRIIDALPFQAIHERHVIRIARDVDEHAIDFNKITDAFLRIVVLIASRNGAEMKPKVIKRAVDAIAKSILATHHDRPEAHRNEMDRIMVGMFVGDQNQIRFGNVSFPCERIDIKDLPFFGSNTERGVTLIK